MLVLVLVMMLSVALALAVVLFVAVPARREGRDVLTAHGEQVVARVKERSESVASVTKGRPARLAASLRGRLGGRTAHAEADAEGGRPSADLPPPSGTANATS